MVELEAPMGLAAFRLESGDLIRRQRERCVVIDRRQAAPKQDLAAEFQFLASLISGVNMARRLQPLKLFLVEGEAVRLLFLAVPVKSEPLEIGLDRVGIF